MTDTTAVPLGEAYIPFADNDPYPLYARARREEPVFFSPALNAWVVTRYHDVRTVLGNPKAYSLATVPDSLAKLSPEAYVELAKTFSEVPVAIREDAVDEARKRVRTPILKAFSDERTASMTPFIQSRVDLLVDRFEERGHAEFMTEFARQLPVRVKAPVLGLDEADLEAFVTGTSDFMELHSVAAQLSVAEQVDRASKVVAYQKLLDSYAIRRHEHPRDDLFSELVQAMTPDGEPLTTERRKALVDTMTGLIAAGHFTSSAAIGTALWHLLAHRDQWERLCAEPELVDTAIEELVRFDMPLRGLMRRVTKSVRLAGIDFAPGDELMVVYQSANRDEAVYERPDHLDIARSGAEHFGYGHGSRSCVGADLGRAMLRITLLTLVDRLPGLRLAPGKDVRCMPGLHKIVRELHIRW